MTLDMLLIFLLSAAVGILSSLIGVGGGVLLVPIFTLIFKIPLLQALAMSLCCVMATSVTSAAKYLSLGLVDIRAALTLQITTIIASYVGGKVVGLVNPQVIAVVFSGVLVATAITLLIPRRQVVSGSDANPHRYPLALGASTVAGTLVGLLGIGGGIVQVPILQFCLGKSIKQAVATSTLMLGISASVAIIPYLNRGNVPFAIVPFAALGTVGGAFIGSRVFHRIESFYIKLLFVAVLVYTAVNMILKVSG